MSKQASTSAVKATHENVNTSHGRLGKSEIPLALVKAVIGMSTLAIGVTYDSDYSSTTAAFWLRVDKSTGTFEELMQANGWHYSAKNRLAYAHKADEAAILFLMELGVDATKYAPKADTKSTRVAATVTTPTVPMTKAKEQPVTDDKAAAIAKQRAAIAAYDAKHARKTEAPAVKATPTSTPTSLAEWDTDKVYAKLEDTLATVAMLVAELKSRK